MNMPTTISQRRQFSGASNERLRYLHERYRRLVEADANHPPRWYSAMQVAAIGSELGQRAQEAYPPAATERANVQVLVTLPLASLRALLAEVAS